MLKRRRSKPGGMSVSLIARMREPIATAQPTIRNPSQPPHTHTYGCATSACTSAGACGEPRPVT